MTGLKSILSFCFVTISAQAALSENIGFVLCKNVKEVRTIRVENENGHCQTIYSKNGKEQVVGGGKNVSSCQKFMGDVQNNLTGGGWKCRETKNSTVSELEGSPNQ